MDFAAILSSATVLFLVMDPMGNIPLFLSILKNVEEKRRRRIILRELLIALGILLFFLFFGQQLLDFLHLQQESVRLAGGIVLFIIALRMIFPKKNAGIMGDLPDQEPFIVPLAIPLIAGPSALATLILMVRNDPSRMMEWTITLLIAWGLSAGILLSAPFFYRILRERGLSAIERLMGMLLIMISVQMIMDGVRSALYLNA